MKNQIKKKTLSELENFNRPLRKPNQLAVSVYVIMGGVEEMDAAMKKALLNV